MDLALCTGARSYWNRFGLDPFVPAKRNLNAIAFKDEAVLCFQLRGNSLAEGVLVRCPQTFDNYNGYIMCVVLILKRLSIICALINQTSTKYFY